jgi:hypothetical protein
VAVQPNLAADSNENFGKILLDIDQRGEYHFTRLVEKVKRVHASVRGLYGDDSTQYELVGGTRMSDRKSRVRKAVTTE